MNCLLYVCILDTGNAWRAVYGWKWGLRCCHISSIPGQTQFFFVKKRVLIGSEVWVCIVLIVLLYLVGVYLTKNITYPSGDMKFLSFYQKNSSIWLVHSTKQSIILYLFRKISSQYGTEMLQTKQPQQELGKFLSKFILKNHTISKSPPPIPPPLPPNTNTKSANLKWYSPLYIKLYYFGPLTRGSQSCIQGCH